MTLHELINSLKVFDHPELKWFDLMGDGFPEGYDNDQIFLIDLGNHITYSFWTNEHHWDEKMMVIRWCPVPEYIVIDT